MASESPSPAPSLSGIDVSHYQGTVSWPHVLESGVRFAVVKATQGTTYVDPLFHANWDGVKAAGLVRGAYHFYTPGDDPAQQAHHFLSTVKLEDGDLVPTLDIETSNGLSAAEIVQGVETWLTTVQQATGCLPIVYTAPGFWKTLGTAAFGRYPLWVAEYGVSAPLLPSGWTHWTFWQHSQSGTVPGVSGAVDLDTFAGTLEQLPVLRTSS